jgi:hypothetical protein
MGWREYKMRGLDGYITWLRLSWLGGTFLNQGVPQMMR